MKIGMVLVRTLLGLLFLFASLTYFLNLFPKPELSGDVKTFNEGLEAAGYFLPLLKATELLCGLALMTGFFVPLALIILAPVAINIFCFHAFVDSTGLPVAIFVVLALAFLAYYHRKSYAALMTAR